MKIQENFYFCVEADKRKWSNVIEFRDKQFGFKKKISSFFNE